MISREYLLSEWQKFTSILERQFVHGGVKYQFDDSSEWTDVLVGMDAAWPLATIAKYAGRYKQFGNERDLIKMATYAFIVWLQDGYHMGGEAGPFATTVAVKSRHWPEFAESALIRLEENQIITIGTVEHALVCVVEQFVPGHSLAKLVEIASKGSLERRCSCSVVERDLLDVVVLCFALWVMHGHSEKTVHDDDTGVSKTDVEEAGWRRSPPK